MVWSASIGRRWAIWNPLATLALACVVVGCGSSASVASPSGTGVASQRPTATGSSPGATGAAPSATTGAEPLPDPTIADPFTIGTALFDPGLVEVGVVSLVEQMGVAIYGSDGTLLHAGRDVGAGRLWLTEQELRGFVRLGEEDLVGAESENGLLTVADLYKALGPWLPGYSLDQFAATYDQAYADAPDSFAAQVMGNIPIDPTTRLGRIQAWLLLIDGFVGPPAQAGMSQPALLALAGGAQWGGAPGRYAAGRRLGTARARFRPLTVDDQLAPLLSEADLQELLAHIPSLPSTVEFVVEQSGSAHEGHGGPGDKVTFSARYVPAPFKSPVSAHVLMLAGAAASPNLAVTWRSDDPETLAEHGQLAPALGSSSPIGSGTSATYSLKREASDGKGVLAEAPASLFAETGALDLVMTAYDVPSQVENAVRRLVSGTRRARNETFLITWHEEHAISLTLHNEYSVTLQLLGGNLVSLSRFGADDAVGVLTRRADGTYRGFMQAETSGHADGTFNAGLAAGQCHDVSNGKQRLLVVGRLVTAAGGPAPSSITAGQLGNRDLLLSFYPASSPVGTFTQCQPTIPLLNSDGSLAHGKIYLPFNDSRWTSPGTGVRVHLPTAGTLTYVADESALGSTSLWEISAAVPDRGL
jgi:hypothetical protein